MELRPYQVEAADFLLAHDRAMVLAAVGAGKTALTLHAMEKRGGRYLVIAPKRVCEEVWPIEAPKWSTLKLAVAVGTPRIRQTAFDSKADVVVMNYDSLKSIPHLNFDGIVFDELTRLKNPSGKRFKALFSEIDHIQIRWGLTGSFTSNGLEDVFGQCKIVDKSLLGRSKGAFLQKHFVLINKEYGEWAARKGALENVMAIIKPATFLLESKLYKDKLPPLHIVEMRCDMDLKDYNRMKKDFVVQFPTATAVAANAGVVTGKLQQMASGFIYDNDTVASPVPGKYTSTRSTLWLSTHKFDLLDSVLEENQHANTIIAYTYKGELAELQRRYPKALTLDCPDAVARWNRGEIELLLVHPKSAGHGLNLQYGGCKIIFLSLPWSLELYEQTVGRLHRSGQEHAVWCYILITNKTIDERIWGALADKRALSDIATEELR